MDGELQWGGNAEERRTRNVWEEVKTKGWAEDKQDFQGIKPTNSLSFLVPVSFS